MISTLAIHAKQEISEHNKAFQNDLRVKSKDLFTNIPFFANFENFHVKFEFKFCGRITMTLFLSPWRRYKSEKLNKK
jgi:hypothetical protein